MIDGDQDGTDAKGEQERPPDHFPFRGDGKGCGCGGSPGRFLSMIGLNRLVRCRIQLGSGFRGRAHRHVDVFIEVFIHRNQLMAGSIKARILAGVTGRVGM